MPSNTQNQSINQSINYNHKTINQQQAQIDSEEDELDAFYKEIDKQLGIDSSQFENQENNEYKQQNYITSEELFGKAFINIYNQDSQNQSYDEQYENGEKNKNIQNEENITNEQQDEIKDEEHDEHLRQFLEAIKKKKEDELIDNRGALMSDEEVAQEENQEIENYENQGEQKEDYLERIKREAQKKNLKQVEYKSEDLVPFRKDFYIESKEIRQITEQEVKQYRENLGDIQVKGVEVPKPIKMWTQCGLSDRVLHTLIERKKYEKPFPIQCQALPVIMSGRDTIGIAETGSGKTLAYLLPMMRHIADQRPIEEGDGPIGLILVPTRELAMQIYLEAKPFTKAHGFNIVAIYGGTGIKGQLSELKRGCEIVVANSGQINRCFNHIKWKNYQFKKRYYGNY
ncbi:hypothetical protein IMG5_131890 [Ichthyophthirius multifiliis]|uniref:P-loop containing nucleoside triphosphate hydrolase n=1 Tax=Ichthyophthirius multifiliis TaxID=5932 RepID=G0QWG2_ICHMU|nr:hypothetical protein IMG5_131890 [Ichthyophthirius multifiliis]EGR30445.1 hypothetical protein IMG5_131890 [Ichthyophthirius multifiliis]|eukprot:XP_004032032.1 hypothetical protein IMG5_131890 [Ichthyophthirius multifiliis]